jgi:hypothetical protein
MANLQTILAEISWLTKTIESDCTELYQFFGLEFNDNSF